MFEIPAQPPPPTPLDLPYPTTGQLPNVDGTFWFSVLPSPTGG